MWNKAITVEDLEPCFCVKAHFQINPKNEKFCLMHVFKKNSFASLSIAHGSKSGNPIYSRWL